MTQSLQIRYLMHAEQDLYDLMDYVAADAPDSAVALLDALDVRIGGLAEHPEMGPRAQDQRLSELGFRTLVVGAYLVFYKVEETEVVVYRVLHGARDWARIP